VVQAWKPKPNPAQKLSCKMFESSRILLVISVRASDSQVYRGLDQSRRCVVLYRVNVSVLQETLKRLKREKQ